MRANSRVLFKSRVGWEEQLIVVERLEQFERRFELFLMILSHPMYLAI